MHHLSPLSEAASGFSAAYARVVADYVQAQGAPVAPVLEILGLPPAPSTEELHWRVPAWRLSRALQLASVLLNDEHIGMHVASLVRPAHMGSFGYAIMSCPLGRDAVAMLEQLQGLLHNELRGHFAVKGSTLRIRHESLCALPDSYAFWSFFVAARLSFPRWVSGRHLAPLRIDLPCAAPANAQPFLDFIDGPVHFGAAECLELLPADWLGWINPNADPALHGVLSGMAQRKWREETADVGSLKIQLKQAILRAVQRGESPTLDSVVTELIALGQMPGNTTSRQVQRRLAAHELSFKQLMEDARREQALAHLSLTDLPLAKIAAEAGYADISSFHRAVRRWTGMTPMRVRASQNGSG